MYVKQYRKITNWHLVIRSYMRKRSSVEYGYILRVVNKGVMKYCMIIRFFQSESVTQKRLEYIDIYVY